MNSMKITCNITFDCKQVLYLATQSSDFMYHKIIHFQFLSEKLQENPPLHNQREEPNKHFLVPNLGQKP